MSWKRSTGGGDSLLGGQASGDGQKGQQEHETPDQHREADGQVVPGRIGADPSEGTAIVPGATDVGVEYLAEAVWPSVIDVGRGRSWRIPVAVLVELNHRADSSENQDAGGGGDDREHGHLHFLLLDLFADVFGSASHHQAGYEYGHDGKQQNPVESRA